MSVRCELTQTEESVATNGCVAGCGMAVDTFDDANGLMRIPWRLGNGEVGPIPDSFDMREPEVVAAVRGRDSTVQRSRQNLGEPKTG